MKKIPTIQINWDEKRDAVVTKMRELTHLGDIFEHAANFATELYRSAPELAETREPLERSIISKGGLDAQQRIDDALKLREYHADMSSQLEQYDLLTLVMVHENIAREIVRKVFEVPAQAKITPFQRDMLLMSIPVSQAYDNLYLAVRKELLVDETNFEAYIRSSAFHNPSGRVDSALVIEYLEENGIRIKETDEFCFSDTIFRRTDEKNVVQLPWSQAYPDETKMVVDALRGLLSVADKYGNPTSELFDDEAPAYRTYLSDLIAVTESREVDAKIRNELWTRVDTSWMSVSGDLQIIHMMESYWDDALGRRIEPEFTYGLLDTRHGKVNEKIHQLKPRQFAALQNHYGDMVDPIGSYMRSSAGVYAKTLCGSRLYFRNAGQNVPNRSMVRQQVGVKIFLDMHTLTERAQKQKRLIAMLLGEEMAAEVFPEAEYPLYIDLLAGVFVSGHELGHNVFTVEDIEEKLTKKGKDALEEHKADVSIAALIPELFDQDMQKLFVKAYFLEVIRPLMHFDSHRNGGIMSVFGYFESGMLSVDEGGLFDFIITDTTIKKLFAFEKDQLDLMHAIYTEPDYSKARGMAQEQVEMYHKREEDPRMKQLLELISQKER